MYIFKRLYLTPSRGSEFGYAEHETDPIDLGGLYRTEFWELSGAARCRCPPWWPTSRRHSRVATSRTIAIQLVPAEASLVTLNMKPTPSTLVGYTGRSFESWEAPRGVDVPLDGLQAADTPESQLPELSPYNSFPQKRVWLRWTWNRPHRLWWAIPDGVLRVERRRAV